MDELVDAGFVVLGGPLADEHRVVHVVEAESENAVRATYAGDPWSGRAQDRGSGGRPDVIELLRLNYDRAVARHGLPSVIVR